MLLKIFVPLALLIVPILVPINKVHGRDSTYNMNGTISNVTGLDQYAWGNVAPNKTNRYWAHLALAVVVIVYACYVFFDELRGYIRLRQAYLTSPQHRLRASATTVLVTAIPRTWLSVEALDGLYDVFPGGIRNIWINRNLDELNEKVRTRDDIARKLESAETDLIKKCKKAQLKKAAAEAKKNGKKNAKKVIKSEQAAADARGDQIARGAGVSSGDPHQVSHTVGQALHGDDTAESTREAGPGEHERNKPFIPVPMIGEGLGAVGQGIGNLGQTVLGGFKKVRHDVDGMINTTGGFIADDTAPTARHDDRIGDGVAPAYHLRSAESRPPGTMSTIQSRPSAEEEDQSHIHPALRTASNDSTVRPSGSQDDRTFSRQEEISRLPPKPGSQGQISKTMDGAGANSTSTGWKFWRKDAKTGANDVPASARRDGRGDERPLTEPSPIIPTDRAIDTQPAEKADGRKKHSLKVHGTGKEGDEKDGTEYPIAINEEYEDDDFGKPRYLDFIKESDRQTMHLPILGLKWMPALPLLGQKVDTIHWCRKELARLNVEIEQDQQEPEKFPLMNSAFIQFNHQVAAHMACQAISHHLPKQMAPRIVEISPDDIIWDNMSIRWWERYIRTTCVILLVCAMVIGWAFPVAFTGLLSQIGYLSSTIAWLHWLADAPQWVQSVLQGILPPVMLALLMLVLPIILRFLAKIQGVQTGMAIELTVQRFYFAFFFVQVFLVVTASAGVTTFIKQLSDVASVPQLLAQNIPRASNYFFSFLTLQALSVSAGAMLQVMGLVSWFILAPWLDNTARKKWARTTSLNQMQWGTFFPVYTTFASIGMIFPCKNYTSGY
jgi:hypothetical protein